MPDRHKAAIAFTRVPPAQLSLISPLRITVLVMVLLFMALVIPAQTTAQTGSTSTPVPTIEKPDGSGIENLQPIEGKLNLPQYPNMDSNLNRIIQQMQTGQFTAQAAAANAPIHREESVAVTLYVTEGYAQDVWDWLEESGAAPRNIGIDYIEAYIPVSLLAETSQQEGVISVRTIIPPQPAQGTAVTEAIFDIAPEAEYYMANLSSWGDLLDTVDWMTTQGVDVINMSVGFAFAGPGDGTSPFSNSPLTSVDEAVAGEIVWVNSAGNSARANLFGPFTDLNDNGFHDFSERGDECNSVRIELGPLESFTAQLRWDDSWGGASSDLDLYLIPLTGSILRLSNAVAFSEKVQTGGAEDYPFESITLDYGDIPDGIYCFAINSFNDTAPSWIQLFVWGAASPLQHYSTDHSIGNPAESANPGLLAVGAAGRNFSVNNPFDTTIIELFSSQGPTLDGRIKPDIVGADAGQSVTYRSEHNPNGYFFGTSQASPHVAGLAALVKQRFSRYPPAQVAQYLKDYAEERGAAGADNIWGHGFAKLLSSDASPDDTMSRDELRARYDANDDGDIDLDEVSAAIDDYFNGDLTLEEVSTVIDLYFS